MDSVSVSELKAQLSRYLRRVREGGEVQIVDRGKPVARLIGAGGGGADGVQVERLVADGVLRPGNGRMLDVVESEPVSLDIDLLAAVDQERGRPLVKYWDSSALVPLVMADSRSELVQNWVRQDPRVVTLAWTKVEMVSALERMAREGALNRSERRRVLDRVEALAGAWEEVTDVLSVRTRAVSLLARHPLRPADAAQLGAALLLRDLLGTEVPFVCFDERLSSAAEREGLAVLPSP